MKRVLSVGQCVPDQTAISRLLSTHFEVEVRTAATATEALDAVRGESFDLVLVNRRLDVDGSEGLEIIRAMQAEPATQSVPVMLVTNYPEHDQAAVGLGAISGFGKAALQSAETLQRLAAVLS